MQSTPYCSGHWPALIKALIKVHKLLLREAAQIAYKQHIVPSTRTHQACAHRQQHPRTCSEWDAQPLLQLANVVLLHGADACLYKYLQPSLTDVQLTETQTFTLHSRPASTRKILLDFTGHTVTNSAYNANLNISTITVPAFDKVSRQI